MYELMFDLETLDTKPSAVVLSVGAVVWETLYEETNDLTWVPVERFMRVLDIQEQGDRQRTVSQSTLLWWQRQDSTAKAEAFNSVRQPVRLVLGELRDFVNKYVEPEETVRDPNPGINAFWASPATFEFPIWEDLARTFGNNVPWTYRQKYDVRTVVREASYSAKDHQPVPPLIGITHTPVFDCEWQIDLLTAVRNKLGRRIGA